MGKEIKFRKPAGVSDAPIILGADAAPLPPSGPALRVLDSPEFKEIELKTMARMVVCPDCKALIGQQNVNRAVAALIQDNTTPVPFICPNCDVDILIPQDKVPGILYRNV